MTGLPCREVLQKSSNFAQNGLDIRWNICSGFSRSSTLMSQYFSIDSSNDEGGIHEIWETIVLDEQIMEGSCFTDSSNKFKHRIWLFEDRHGR